MASAGIAGAPPSPLNVPIGPHRRFTWVDADLAQFKAIKNALGGTVNDVVLAVGRGRAARARVRRGRDAAGLELKAMVPVSVRADAERGALGNRVAAMWAPLPRRRRRTRWSASDIVHEAMGGLKESGQAVGAEVLTRLAGFAPPTILAQAARLQARQRFFNLVVTNVPGPQFPLYLLGRRLRALYPMVPLRSTPGARHRDHELRRPARLRPARRLRRDARPRGRRRRPRARDRRARGGRAGVRSRLATRPPAAPRAARKAATT